MHSLAFVREYLRYDHSAAFPNNFMPSKSPTDKLLPSLSTWELSDLRELQAALGGLIEALEPSKENLENAADDDDSRIYKFEQTTTKGTRGHIEAKYIPRGNKRHGPYLYLRYWQGGKLRSKYLGKPPKK